MSISEMRQGMTQAGIYTKADIEEICCLESAYSSECAQIAEQCEAEGYPANGSNYDLRCENARRYYDEQIAYIDAKYEDGMYSTEEYQHFAVIHMQELQSKKLHNIEIELNEFQVQMVMDNLPLYKDGAKFLAVSSVREKNENETVM